MLIKTGSTSRMVTVYAYDATTGLPYVTAAYNDGGISLWYRRGVTGAVTAITPATQTVTGAYSSGGFILLNAADNAYRFDIPDAAFAAGVDEVEIGGHATAWKLIPMTVQLAGYDPRTDAVATVAGSLDANAKQLSGDATAADNAEAFFDGTGYAGTNNVIPTVTTVGTLTTYTGNTPQTGDAFARIGATGSGLTTLATQASVNTIDDFLDTEVAAILAAVDTEVAAIKVITDALGATAAARLKLSGEGMIPGTVDNTAFSPTTTVFEADDITEATADHYNGRLVLWTSGALVGQVTVVTDYSLSSGRGQFTVTAMTEAPANNDTFLLV